MPVFFSENPTCQYNYEWETPAGCPQDSPPTEVPTKPPTVPPTTTPPPTESPTTPPPGDCQLASYEWTALYHDRYDNDTLVVDNLSFSGAGTFVQELRPYEYTECHEHNTVTWTGTFNQFNTTTTVFIRQACNQDAAGCLKCGPTSTEYITTKYQPDCLSFMWTSDDADSEPRTYSRVA